MKMQKIALYTLVLAVLAGCSGRVGDIINLSRPIPDEFAVVKREPLSLPPDFALRPPAESDRSSQVAITDTRLEAKTILFGETANENTPATQLDAGDVALLARTGEALPNIRRLVDQESTDLIKADRSFVKDLFSGLLPPDEPGKVLDPVDAERRVKQSVLLSSQPEVSSGITIERNVDTDFAWDSLWPF